MLIKPSPDFAWVMRRRRTKCFNLIKRRLTNIYVSSSWVHSTEDEPVELSLPLSKTSLVDMGLAVMSFYTHILILICMWVSRSASSNNNSSLHNSSHVMSPLLGQSRSQSHGICVERGCNEDDNGGMGIIMMTSTSTWERSQKKMLWACPCPCPFHEFLLYGVLTALRD
jgi:hypothetical protein